jgi:hypothetical protein
MSHRIVVEPAMQWCLSGVSLRDRLWHAGWRGARAIDSRASLDLAQTGGGDNGLTATDRPRMIPEAMTSD